MFSNILSELSSSADIAGKAVVERYSSVCVQVGTVVVDDGLPGQVSDRAVSDLKGSGVSTELSSTHVSAMPLTPKLVIAVQQASEFIKALSLVLVQGKINP
jgi:hypothetical protein